MRKRTLFLTMTAAALAAAIGATSAPAQETPHAGYRETGSSQDWVGIYSPDRGTGERTASCAIYSRPVDTAVFQDGEPVEIIRGELAAYIAWNARTPSREFGEISFVMGAPIREGRDVGHTLTVDGQTSFDLVGINDRLYVMPADDAEALSAVQRGFDMVVTAITEDGRVIKDTYSLRGILRMTDVSAEECR